MFEDTYGKRHFCTVEKQTSNSFLPHLADKASLIARLLRKYKKSIQVSQNDPLSQEFFRSTTGYLNERRRHAESGYTYIIHPFSDFASYRERILLLTHLLTFITAPLIAAFLDYGILYNGYLYAIELTSTVIYILDIFIKCFVGFENMKTKEVVLIQKKIIRNYVISFNFMIDITSALSFYISEDVIDLEKFYYLTYLRVLKLLEVPTFLRYWNRVSLRLKVTPVVVELTRYIVSLILIIHWFASLIFFITAQEIKAAPTEQNLTKLKSSEFPFPLYFKDFFITVGLIFSARTQFSDQSTLIELWVIIIICVVGKIFLIAFTVTILNQVLNQWSLETRYLGIMDQLAEFMRYKKLPIRLRARLEYFFEYKFQKRYFREKVITSMLSDKLKREINIHICKRLVQQDNFLAALPTNVLGDILTRLKSEVFLPNDIIIRAGAPADFMYFLSSGTVSVTTPSGKEVCHLSDGAYFGEIGLLWKEMRRTANVVALDICETYKLDKKSFKILKKYPECMRLIQSIAEIRHQKTTALEELYKEELFHKAYIEDGGSFCIDVYNSMKKSHSVLSF